MYNKTKYLTGKISGILAIVLGGLIIFGEIFNIIVMNKFDHNIGYRFFLLLLIRLIVRFVLGGIFISHGLTTLHKPFLYTKSPSVSFWLDTNKKKNIVLIILSGALLLTGLLSIPLCGICDIFDFFIYNSTVKIDVRLLQLGTWLNTFASLGRMTLPTFLPFGQGFRIDIVTQWIIQTPLCLLIFILKIISLAISVQNKQPITENIVIEK